MHLLGLNFLSPLREVTLYVRGLLENEMYREMLFWRQRAYNILAIK